MADRVEHFTVTAATGSTAAAPVEIATPFNPGEVERVDIVVPDGHAGLTGIALAHAHQRIVPRTPGSFFIANAETILLDLENEPNAGAWSAFVYNTDIYSHNFYLRFLVREVGRRSLILEPTGPGSGGGGAGPPGEPPPPVGPPPVEPPPPDEPPPPEEPPPPDEPPPVEPPAEEPPPADEPPVQAEPPPIDEPPPAPEPPPPPPPPPPPVIVTYPLPPGYDAGPIPTWGDPPNVHMLIGQVLGHALIGGGSNSAGSYNTWRFFSDLGNTMDWHFYYAGAKALQWVGPFNLRAGVPGG